jgi:hypothetical protein
MFDIVIFINEKRFDTGPSWGAKSSNDGSLPFKKKKLSTIRK